MTKTSCVLSAEDKSNAASIFEHAANEAIESRGKAPLRAGPGRVRLLRTDSGRVVTHGEVVQGLFKKLDIEVQVIDGKRPTHARCQFTGCVTIFELNRNGTLRKYCKDHSTSEKGHVARIKCVTPTCFALVRIVHSRGGRAVTGLCRRCAHLDAPQPPDIVARANAVRVAHADAKRSALTGTVVNGWTILGFCKPEGSYKKTYRVRVSCVDCNHERVTVMNELRIRKTHRCCAYREETTNEIGC